MDSSPIAKSRVGFKLDYDKIKYPQKSSDIQFDSLFESANLELVKDKDKFSYELYIRNDSNAASNNQWFYYRIKVSDSQLKNQTIKMNIMNFTKPNSLFQQGMKVSIFSKQASRQRQLNWTYGGINIQYTRSEAEKEINEINPNKVQNIFHSQYYLGDSTINQVLSIRQNIAMTKFISPILCHIPTIKCKTIQKVYKCFLIGKDMNRCFYALDDSQYRTQAIEVDIIQKYIRDNIYSVQKGEQKRELKMVLDIHTHSSQKGIFTFAPQMQIQDQLKIRIFPQKLDEVSPFFRLQGCKFGNESSKKNCARLAFDLFEFGKHIIQTIGKLNSIESQVDVFKNTFQGFSLKLDYGFQVLHNEVIKSVPQTSDHKQTPRSIQKKRSSNQQIKSKIKIMLTDRRKEQPQLNGFDSVNISAAVSPKNLFNDRFQNFDKKQLTVNVSQMLEEQIQRSNKIKQFSNQQSICQSPKEPYPLKKTIFQIFNEAINGEEKFESMNLPDFEDLNNQNNPKLSKFTSDLIQNMKNNKKQQFASSQKVTLNDQKNSTLKFQRGNLKSLFSRDDQHFFFVPDLEKDILDLEQCFEDSNYFVQERENLTLQKQKGTIFGTHKKTNSGKNYHSNINNSSLLKRLNLPQILNMESEIKFQKLRAKNLEITQKSSSQNKKISQPQM
eukprot:403352049